MVCQILYASQYILNCSGTGETCERCVSMFPEWWQLILLILGCSFLLVIIFAIIRGADKDGI